LGILEVPQEGRTRRRMRAKEHPKET
jgi:hypothetical protein